MKPLIYLDMDRVICDFMYMYDRLHMHVAETKKFHSLVKDHYIFERLPKMPNADKLLTLLTKQLDVNVCILSSLGTYNKEVAQEAQRQKEFWLDENGITFPRKFVNSWIEKQKHAFSSSIMIDDRGDVISTFIDAGGLGVHYIDEDWVNMEYRIRQAVTAVNQKLGENYAAL